MPQDLLVYSTYATRSQIEEAVKQLKGAGFSSDDITVLYPQADGKLEPESPGGKDSATYPGGITLSVHCEDPDAVAEVREIMGRTGAQNIRLEGDTTAI